MEISEQRKVFPHPKGRTWSRWQVDQALPKHGVLAFSVLQERICAVVKDYCVLSFPKWELLLKLLCSLPTVLYRVV